MTEKERFKLRLSKLGNGMITDTQKREDLYFDKEFLNATLPKATEWLNKLSDENEQLKKDREELFIRERDTKNEWRELKQENEMLKQQLQSILELTKKIEDCTHDVKLIGDLE